MTKFLKILNLAFVFVLLSAAIEPVDVTATPKSYVDIGEQDESPVMLKIDQGTLVKVSVPAAAVFVADPDVADVQVKTPRLIYVYGRGPGMTSLYAVDENENILMNRRVTVRFETNRLQQAINDMLPGADIKVEALNRTVVLRGHVQHANHAADAVAFASRFIGEGQSVVNQLKITGANQVNLRVTIAEMSRNTLKDVGINWDAATTIGNFVFGLATGSPVLAAGGGFLRGVNGENNGALGFNSSDTSINALIDALEDEGLVKVMAKPNLTALSGETASFLSGGEFPVPVAQDDDRVTVEFREFGVSLAFTPTLIDGERISLRVRPEVSALTNTGAFNDGSLVIPALTTRRAETTVEMGSGQSFAIAGLIQQEVRQDNESVPGLNEAPGISSLFQSDAFAKEETELVIIVTPYIVRPTNQKLSTPLDEYKAPTDRGRYLNRDFYQPTKGRVEDMPAEKAGFELN